ncbi:MAG: hypothetical protein Q7S55_01035 [Nanoarchaeota archaeon]|nr:hypothetical protein [Nanoarchaeota archaeon]
MTSLKQKLTAILVLSLFMLSVIPAGLAKNIVEFEVDTEAEVESDAADAEVKSGSKTEVDTDENDSETKNDSEEVKEKIKLRTKGGLKTAARVSKEVKFDLSKARERLEEAKEQYKEARENQREYREKVLELHKVVRRCNDEKQNCTALKVELRVGVKNHLLKSVQVVERSLEKLTKTIEKMEDLSEEEKEFALALVADLEAELDVQKAKIDNFTNETSQEEIRAAIKDLKELNQKVHKMQRRLVGLLVNAKLHILIEKQAELHAGMQARIDAAAETGADVSELEAILAEFDAKVVELEQDYKNAQEKWMEAKEAVDFDQFNRELREAQHEVREDLQDIKQILRKFVAEYKDLTENAEEAENETEEDSENINESTQVETNTSVETNTTVEANASAEATA